MTSSFIVNASRSGSTMLSNMLRLHPDMLSLSEFMTNQGARALLPGHIDGPTYWQQLARPTPLMRHLVNPHSAPDEFLYHHCAQRRFDPFACPPLLAVTLPHLFAQPDPVFDDLQTQVARLPLQSRADHHRAVIAMLAARTAKTHWVERSGGTLIATSALAQQFPDARFVVILRDGRDVTLSMQNYKPARFVIWFWKQARRMGIDIFKPGAQIGSAPWIALTERLSGRILPYHRILNTPPTLRDAAACWSALTLSGLTQFSALPAARRHVIRYETLVRAPHATLSDLAGFLGLSPNAAWLDVAAKIPQHRPPRHLSLPPSDLSALSAQTAPARALSDRMT